MKYVYRKCSLGGHILAPPEGLRAPELPRVNPGALRGKTQEVVDKIGEEKGPCFINYHYKIHPKHEKNRQVPDVLFCKSGLSKMASVKTNKIKNQTAL